MIGKKESDLRYPNMKADLKLCNEQLAAICRGERGPLAVMSVPPRTGDFDMQFSAAFDELEAYRATGLCPTICAEYKKFEDEAVAKGVPFSRIIELMEAEKSGRLLVLPAAPGETVYYADEDAGRVMMGYINGYRIRNNRAISFEFFNLELDVEWHSISLPLEEFGKTVFFKEEKAEKVLGGAEYDA